MTEKKKNLFHTADIYFDCAVSCETSCGNHRRYVLDGGGRDSGHGPGGGVVRSGAAADDADAFPYYSASLALETIDKSKKPARGSPHQSVTAELAFLVVVIPLSSPTLFSVRHENYFQFRNLPHYS
jgi:hypothetical protein